MRGHWKQTYVEWGLVALLAGLCTILSVLQYRWTGEVSRVETEHLRAGVSDQAQQFSRAFDIALAESCDPLVPKNEVINNGNREAVHLQHFQQWKPIRPRPFFSRIAVAVPISEGVRLFFQSQMDGKLRQTAWPDEWKDLLQSLNDKKHAGQPPPGSSAVTLFEFPVFAGPHCTNPPAETAESADVFGPEGECEWMIFQLDANYFGTVWLPELADLYLNPADQPIYDVVVKTVTLPSRVIFASRPGALKNSAPAVIEPLKLAARIPENNGLPGRDLSWQLEVRPRPGALEAVVGAAHRRNLAVAVFLNGLIFAAGYALVRHTRHSRQLAEAQLNFVANVSHELRTPLTVIRGAAHNLKRGVVHERAQVEQYAGLIMQHAEQLGEMVEQVLTLAGARKKDGAFSSQPVVVADLLNAAIDATAHDTQSAQCTVHLEVPPDLPVVPGDAPALRRVFQNLITNAAKHAGDGRWISITAVTDTVSRPPVVEVQVADRGPGIPAAEQAEIFKPFARGTRAQLAQIRGSGLGLSLVKEIVEAHGGTVSVCSTNGHGATFSVRLPVEYQKN